MALIDTFIDQMETAKASGLPFDGYYHAGKTARLRIGKAPSKPRSALPLCGAVCRDGHPCQAKVCLKPDGSTAKRCRLHGGLSSGPKSKEGRERIAESNRKRGRAVVNSGQTTEKQAEQIERGRQVIAEIERRQREGLPIFD